jgi:hypothetical protein
VDRGRIEMLREDACARSASARFRFPYDGNEHGAAR